MKLKTIILITSCSILCTSNLMMRPQEKECQQPSTSLSEYETVLAGSVGAMFLLLTCWHATDFIFGRYAQRDPID